MLEECLINKKTGKNVKPDRQLDCIGLFCPEPVYRTRQEIDKLAKGQVLEVVADDSAAEGDITSLAKRLNLDILEVTKEGGSVRILIKK